MPSSSSRAGADLRPYLRAALVAGLAWTVLFLGLLAVRDGDVTVFIHAGDFFVDPSRAPEGLHVRKDSHGYDGQFFYRLALDPWTDEPEALGIRIDRPPYRQQRILYPLLVRTLAWGRPEAVPAAMVAANGLALVMLAVLGTAWALRAGLPAWLGLCFSLYPGLVLAFARNLAEATEAAAIAGGLWLLRGPNAAWSAVPLSLAVLAREPAILVVGAVFLAWLPRPVRVGTAADGARPPAVAWLAPLATFLGWQAWIATRWSQPFLLGTAERGLRKSAVSVFDRLSTALHGDGTSPIVTTLEIGGLLVLLGAVLLTLRASRATRVEKLAALLLGALLFTRGESVWIEDWSFLRISAGFWIPALMVVAQAPGRLALSIPRVALAAWVLLAAQVLMRG